MILTTQSIKRFRGDCPVLFGYRQSDTAQLGRKLDNLTPYYDIETKIGQQTVKTNHALSLFVLLAEILERSTFIDAQEPNRIHHPNREMSSNWNINGA